MKENLRKREPLTSTMEAYVVNFASDEFWANNAAFIAIRKNAQPQGMNLILDPITEKICGGSMMMDSKAEERVKELQAPVDGGRMMRWGAGGR